MLLGYMKDMNALVEGNTDPWVIATVLYFRTHLSEEADADHQPLLLEIFKDILCHPNTNEELYIPFLCAQNFFGKHTEFEKAMRQTSKIRVSGKSLSKEGRTLWAGIEKAQNKFSKEKPRFPFACKVAPLFFV
ncbi:MAG: hypothetical protein ACK5TR_04650 [Alphaproteobacteria bacterium]|nr:hypothetical protein [Alphaproteobacteria bacterium]